MSPKKPTILIADDDTSIRDILSNILNFKGYRTLEAADGKEALERIENEDINLVLLDLKLPRVDGLDVLKKTLELKPNLPVVIISGHGTIRTAVEATKIGAYDFLEKPLETERTLLTIKNALDKYRLVKERNLLLEDIKERYQMVGSSSVMQNIYQLIDKAASKNVRVLIEGENGTGKELIARAIHSNSSRAGRPFVAVNCAAIPESLIESELFGYKKGAFTGALADKPGKFQLAEGGTLFLDEIGDMSLITQAKVLRALEEEAIEPIGGNKPIAIDVRIIAATNKNLQKEMDEKNFREDLFYRLNVVSIRVPPLREHKEDIPSLVEHFLKLFCEENKLPLKTVSPKAMTILLRYDWPGNVRELKNLLEKLVVLVEGERISSQDVLNALSQQKPLTSNLQEYSTLKKAREQFEKKFITEKLIANNWKISETAKLLGIERAHLWKKMRKYGIEKRGD